MSGKSFTIRAEKDLVPGETSVYSIKRLTILLGEIDARGSDKQATSALVHEAIAIVKDLVADGTINKEEYSEIIDSIA